MVPLSDQYYLDLTMGWVEVAIAVVVMISCKRLVQIFRAIRPTIQEK